MSILIKGITLDEFTSLDGNIGDFVNDEQLDVIEVPEPHGRLIDADKMVQYLHHQECDSCKTPDSDKCFACREPFAEAVTDLQPTVIGGEGE